MPIGAFRHLQFFYRVMVSVERAQETNGLTTCIVFRISQGIHFVSAEVQVCGQINSQVFRRNRIVAYLFTKPYPFFCFLDVIGFAVGFGSYGRCRHPVPFG